MTFSLKGCDIPKSLIWRCNEAINGLLKGTGAVEHPIRQTPSNVDVKGNLERLSDPTLDLQPFEVLNALPRQLDLVDMRIDWRQLIEKTDLDSKGANCSDDIQRSAEDAVGL